MSSSGFQAMPGWYWPDDISGARSNVPADTASEPLTTESTPKQETPRHQPSQGPSQEERQRQRHWRPRTCRICLETVDPTFHPPSENLPGFLQSGPSVTYDSEEGRLLRPCKCKGSSKYVHENCLQAWRHADPAYGRRNFWQCPTCGFRYRLERMHWGRIISSAAAQITLTITLFVLATFLLGFVADPIINIYLDPYEHLIPIGGSSDSRYAEPEDPASWFEHFLKGFASLGLLSFLKVLLASPWRWWNIRVSGGMGGGGRAGNTGRDRLANISWVVVLIGVGTFLYGVWKAVRTWTRRTLEKAGERVMDVQVDDDDEDEDDEPGASSAPTGTTT
ncbi:hypothetical protein W97_03988 [Coniosporium apollinis CBS 100218]|uniref:RING-CH-type domain-containing protein n=1 Tax=Coniosporium apollinis (strain CBS 100218) TaxID=1168221 RepID=R7YS73_CONA1|nr:uncharacterized protein W97_03988 [Coniosporium apollinis CBS 100218]EON64755.1 hypothetical protein W97_03988 [Coniosporium apollinis CBS 100218]